MLGRVEQREKPLRLGASRTPYTIIRLDLVAPEERLLRRRSVRLEPARVRRGQELRQGRLDQTLAEHADDFAHGPQDDRLGLLGFARRLLRIRR